MSFAASIAGAKVGSLHPAIPVSWSEVQVQDLCAWNDALFRSGASMYQYPFWNEPYRHLGVTPRYLVWGAPDRPRASVTILTVGGGPAKIGIVFRGPSVLAAGTELSQSTYARLFQWARGQGYMFLRFTHSDPETLSGLAEASECSIAADVFPYFQDYSIVSGDYMVKQYESDEETLLSFDREVRRKLRRAEEAGYEFRSDDTSDSLEKAWTLYQECARRKQFRIERPLSFYQNVIQGARLNHLARLYNVHLAGRIVGSTLVVRDRTTAHCQLAAFDAEHRNAATFLHWKAMRDMHRTGVERYNLGPGPGSLARFKSMFAAQPVQYPGALTVVLKESWFRVWRKAFTPAAKRLHPMVRKLAIARSVLTR